MISHGLVPDLVPNSFFLAVVYDFFKFFAKSWVLAGSRLKIILNKILILSACLKTTHAWGRAPTPAKLARFYSGVGNVFI